MDRTLLLAVDNEGGTVKRLPDPHIQLPPAAEARAAGLGTIFETARNAGRELKHLGFNLNLAPVLDLTAEGSFLTTRTFSGDPAEVSNCAKVFVEGFRSAGILCCGKHFPGLGAASQDPHSTLPSVDLDKKQMQSHIKPFKDLIDAKLSLIMTSHCLYPGVGIAKPATFAKEIPALLRRELGFEGLIVSDDLEMGAVTNDMQPGAAAVEAVLAGHDLILICRKLDLIEQAHEALAESLAAGLIPANEFIESFGRLCSVVDSCLGFE
jgi:beta-N-acetylhexosaminidase